MSHQLSIFLFFLDLERIHYFLHSTPSIYHFRRRAISAKIGVSSGSSCIFDNDCARRRNRKGPRATKKKSELSPSPPFSLSNAFACNVPWLDVSGFQEPNASGRDSYLMLREPTNQPCLPSHIFATYVSPGENLRILLRSRRLNLLPRRRAIFSRRPDASEKRPFINDSLLDKRWIQNQILREMHIKPDFCGLYSRFTFSEYYCSDSCEFNPLELNSVSRRKYCIKNYLYFLYFQ